MCLCPERSNRPPRPPMKRRTRVNGMTLKTNNNRNTNSNINYTSTTYNSNNSFASNRKARENGKPTRRRVFFSSKIEVKEIPSTYDLTNDEKAAVYMKPYDFQRIRKDIVQHVESTPLNPDNRPFDEDPYETDESDDESNYYVYNTETNSSIRGLEMWVSESSQRRDRTWEIVQAILRYQSFGNPQVTATLYRNFATPAVHEAHMTALRDEQQVIRCRH